MISISTLPVVKFGQGLHVGRILALVVPGTAILISVAILFLVIWPKVTEVLRLRAENVDIAGRVASLQNKAQILEAQDRVKLEGQLAVAEQLLPSDKAVFSFIGQIETIASNSGVLMNKIDVAPGAVGGGEAPEMPQTVGGTAGGVGTVDNTKSEAKIQVKVALTSDYRALLSFLGGTMGVARVTAIRDLTISSSASEGSAPLRSTMTIDAYFKTLPSELGSIESAVVELSEVELTLLVKVKNAIDNQTTTTVVLPQVPLGKEDLFTPF